MNEHDYEPVLGLPAPLPEGETILWQGAPGWRTFARRAMRVRVVSSYFVLLAIWGITTRISSGMPLSEVALSTFRWSSLAITAIALLLVFAWLVARTTRYTITTRRVVVRFGIALPITIQIPFRKINAADARLWPDGTGDIALSLMPGERIGYLIVWPHARPWKLAKAQPALRGIPDAAEIAQILARALAASALQPAKAISVPGSDIATAGSHVAAVA